MSHGFTGIEKLKRKLLTVLNQIHKEKEEERVIVDIWCHFGHAYITKVDEGKKILCFLSIVVAIDISLSVFRRNFNSN